MAFNNNLTKENSRWVLDCIIKFKIRRPNFVYWKHHKKRSNNIIIILCPCHKLLGDTSVAKIYQLYKNVIILNGFVSFLRTTYYFKM